MGAAKVSSYLQEILAEDPGSSPTKKKEKKRLGITKESRSLTRIYRISEGKNFHGHRDKGRSKENCPNLSV